MAVPDWLEDEVDQLIRQRKSFTAEIKAAQLARAQSDELEERGRLAHKASDLYNAWMELGVKLGQIALARNIVFAEQVPFCCTPAHDLGYDEIQTRLSEWLSRTHALGLTANHHAILATTAERLLLAWCGQIVVGQGPHHVATADQQDFLFSARSVYDFALNESLGQVVLAASRRSHPILLAHACFPLLEGIAR